MPIGELQMLKLLSALPEAVFESLEENPTTRLDLELSIQHGDVTAFAALAYAAWLGEEKGASLADEHWQAFAQLADKLNERETLETYWPARLPRPWPSAPGRESTRVDEQTFAALKAQGRSVVEIAQALRDAGATEMDAVHVLRSLFGMSLRDALTLVRAP